MFDGTVDAKGMKTKDIKKFFGTFLTMIKQKIPIQKVWVNKGTEIAGECIKVSRRKTILLSGK